MKQTVADLIEQLEARALPDGGWSYGGGTEPFAEPTLLGALALSAWNPGHEKIAPALQVLLQMQNVGSGAVGISRRDPWPTWPTSQALVAWRLAGGKSRRYVEPIKRGIGWLLGQKGTTAPRNPIFGHDTTLAGWPWVAGTHSWVEPTAFAVLACKALGGGAHRRIREGVRLILDRAVRTGGWNYGNNRVLANELRAFPACTGIALLALVGETAGEKADKALAFLAAELDRVRAPMSLSWSLMGMTAWSKRPADADALVAESAARLKNRPFRSVDVSLLLLAAAGERSAFVRAAKIPAKPKVNQSQPTRKENR